MLSGTIDYLQTEHVQIQNRRRLIKIQQQLWIETLLFLVLQEFTKV